MLFQFANARRSAMRRTLGLVCAATLLLNLGGCSTRQLIAQSVANELASQGKAPEDDLVLAREASAFYLKLSESLLREVPDNAKLAEALASGFTQYAYAFVALDADRIEAKDAKAAEALRQRAARLYWRGNQHAMGVLERLYPGLRKSLEGPASAVALRIAPEHSGLAYWAAASWGGFIALSKDKPETVADLPSAIRLAQWAYDVDPMYGEGATAGLMGTFEAARPGGSAAQALRYFDLAIAASEQRSAGPWVGKAEAVALPAGDRAEFERLLQKAITISAAHPGLANAVMRERALWLLGVADDLF